MTRKEYIRRLTDEDRIRCDIMIEKGGVIKLPYSIRSLYI